MTLERDRWLGGINENNSAKAKRDKGKRKKQLFKYKMILN